MNVIFLLVILNILKLLIYWLWLFWTILVLFYLQISSICPVVLSCFFFNDFCCSPPRYEMHVLIRLAIYSVSFHFSLWKTWSTSFIYHHWIELLLIWEIKLPLAHRHSFPHMLPLECYINIVSSNCASYSWSFLWMWGMDIWRCLCCRVSHLLLWIKISLG